jgi:cation diffusion facilitator CzcD-associated flavoprotein CzcO
VQNTSQKHFNVVIAGSGFSGLGAAIRLKQEGFDDLVIFERSHEVGGVWRDNSYPGAACDVESHLYSFSFAPNPRWSHAFSRQPEIFAYLRECAHTYGLLKDIRFNTSVKEAAWDQASQRWVIETTAGTVTANFFIPAIGLLSEPQLPNIPGLDRFQGRMFHSARWQHDYDLTGRKVAVIGTGASAVQFVPEIQPKVEKLLLFQRTPAWVLPRWDEEFSEQQKARYESMPLLQKLVRGSIYLRRELFVLGFRNPNVMRQLVERFALRYLEQTVTDPVLRQKLTPNFRIGCKRILITAGYLPALTQPNVDVITHGIREVRERSIVTDDGVEHPVDTIIFGTGFHVMDVPFADHVRGREGRTLSEVWAGSPAAHLGTMIAGFPNLFFLMGPNTGLGHTSVLLMLESQLNIVLGALQHLRKRKLSALEPLQAAQDRFFAWVQNDAKGTVWTAGGCASWYLDANGKLTSLWTRTTWAFRKRAQFRPEEYALQAPASPQLEAAE